MSKANHFLAFSCMIALLCIFASKVVAQPKHVYTIPSPTIGWDSLQAKIPYDEILRRAGLEGAYKVTLRIDSIGNVLSDSISLLNDRPELSESDRTLVWRIEYGLKGVRWLPATDNGVPVSCTFSIPIIFYLTYSNVARPIIKHAEVRGTTSLSPGYFFK